MRSLYFTLIAVFFISMTQVGYSSEKISSNPIVSSAGDFVFIQLTPPLSSQTKVFIFNKKDILCIRDTFEEREHLVLFTFKATSDQDKTHITKLEVRNVEDRTALMTKLVEILKESEDTSR